MRRLRITLAAALLIPAIAAAADTHAGITGAWSVAVDSPGGSLRLDLMVAETGGRLTGAIAFLGETLLLQKLEFEPPRIAAELRFGESTVRAWGVLDRGKLGGEWSIAGRHTRGTWTGERKRPQPAALAVEEIVGVWPVSLYLPNGVLHLTLTLERIDGTLVGTLSGDAGTVILQSIDFDGRTLRFEVHLLGEIYRFESTLEDRKLVGRWLAGGGWSSSGKKTSP